MVLEGILASWAAGKGLDKLSGVLGNKAFGDLQERTVKRVFIEARKKLKKRYENLWEKLYQESCWEAAEEEIALLLDPSTGGKPDVRKIAKIVSPVDGLNDDEVIEGLKYFFEYVRKELSEQPDILIIETLRTALGVKEDIKTLCEQLNIVEDIASIDAKAHQASILDIEKFISDRGFLSFEDTVPLSLFRSENGDRRYVEDGELFLSLIASKTIVLEAGPGAGKTTTLLSLASKLLETSTACIPVFVPLPEWEANGYDPFEYIQRREAFNQAISIKNVQELARHGHLVLLLDGWNELAGEPLKKAKHAVIQLCRDYPNIGVVIATRKTAPPPTIEEKTIHLTLDGLSDEHRGKLIKDHMGQSEGEAIIQQIYENRELDQITRIPLYLTILLEVVDEGVMPETKEQLLCQFIRKHENLREHKDALTAMFSEDHEAYLENLAVAIMEADSTALDNAKARPVVKRTAEELQSHGQISQIPDLDRVLNCLAEHHLIVRDGDIAWRFQHHQFQEWFLSKHVERRLVAAVSQKDAAAEKEVRHICLNVPRWEEAVLFASERLSRQDGEGVQAVAQLVRWGLEIDPLLSAEIIYRSHSDVWEAIKTDVIEFVNAWHTPGKDDRALAFMIASGKPEFSDLVWACITDLDSQIRLGALRRYEPFRVSVLGDDWVAKLDVLGDRVRATVVSQIISNGGWNGINAGTEAAISTPCTLTKIDALDALSFRQSRQHIKKLLESAQDEAHEKLTDRIAPDDIGDDPALRDQIIQTLLRKLDRTTEPKDRLRILSRLVDWGNTDVWPQIFDSFSDLNEEKDDREFFYYFLKEASQIDAEKTSSAIINRMMNGQQIKHGWEQFLVDANNDERTSLAKLVYDGALKGHSQKIVVKLLHPEQILPFLNTFLDVTANQNGNYQHLRDILRDADSTALIETVLHLDALNDPEKIIAMASLLSWHGDENRRSRFLVPADIENRFRAELKRWIEVLNGAVDTSLGGLADIAVILGRISNHDDLAVIRQLLDKNIETKNRQREEWEAIGCDQSRRPPGVSACYLNRYQQAFEMMAAHPNLPETMAEYLRTPEFAKEAAYILRDRWIKENRNWEEEEQGTIFSSRPDYSKAIEKARILESGAERLTPDYLSAIILDRIEELMPADGEQENTGILISLCAAVADMNYGNRYALIEQAMHLEGNNRSKRSCLTKLAENGEKLDSEIIEAACRKVLEQWLPDAWNKDNDWYQVREWLDLLAFSDNPQKILEILQELPPNLLRTYHLRELCSALMCSPCDWIDAVLLGLWDILPDVTSERYWIRTCHSQMTEKLKTFFLDVLWDVEKLGRVTSVNADRDTFIKIMVSIFNDDAAAYTDLKQKMSEPLADSTVYALTKIVGQLDKDDEILFSALNMLSNENGTTNRYVREMVCKIATRHESIGGNNGMYHMYKIMPHKIEGLRQKLFKIMCEDEERNVIARKILEDIDDLRDEHGRPPREPRHPCIESEKPWPQIQR